MSVHLIAKATKATKAKQKQQQKQQNQIGTTRCWFIFPFQPIGKIRLRVSCTEKGGEMDRLQMIMHQNPANNSSLAED